MNYIRRALSNDNTDSDEIDARIERISGSAIELRNTIGNIILKRLARLFHSQGKEITRNSRLAEIFPKSFSEADWYELERIGLRLPGLQRAKMFRYLSVTYLIIAFGALLIFAIVNLDLAFVAWGLPVFGVLFTLTASPILLFMLIFKRRHFPCDSIDNLIDQIISINWTDLITEDKTLFKEIVRQEIEVGDWAQSQDL